MIVSKITSDYIIIIAMSTDAQVSYEFKNWNLVFLNQPMIPYMPFSVKVRLPKPDHGKRGFSDAYINKVKKDCTGKKPT